MTLKVGDRVKILYVESVLPVWRGKEGLVVEIFEGTAMQKYFEVEVHLGECRPKYFLFRGDELEVLK